MASFCPIYLQFSNKDIILYELYKFQTKNIKIS